MPTFSSAYSLDVIHSIIARGFDYTIPTETQELISRLTQQVGGTSAVTAAAPNEIASHLFARGATVPYTNNNNNNNNNTTAPIVRRRLVPQSNLHASTTFAGTAVANSLSNVNVNSVSGHSYSKRPAPLSAAATTTTPIDWTKKGDAVLTEREQGDNHNGSNPLKSHSKPIDVIRTHLNKITDKNGKDIFARIVYVIESMESEHKNLEEIGQMILGIVSNNRYYSGIYADLYLQLCEQYASFRALLLTKWTAFEHESTQLNVVNPDEDYDGFCEYNKQCEKRKALASFFMNIYKRGRYVNANAQILSGAETNRVTRILIRQLQVYLETTNKKSEVDELMEIVALMFDSDNDPDEAITDFIQSIADETVQNNTRYPSFTSKTKYKCMDLMESVE